MRKMMFNDRCGLTASVIRKAKWKTRRITERVVRQWDIAEELTGVIGNPTQRELTLKEFALKVCPIKVGEVIAVAQSYREIYPDSDFEMIGDEFITESPGWGNKMFVKAEYMPVRIKITGVDFERLQDISDEDCLAEGSMSDMMLSIQIWKKSSALRSRILHTSMRHPETLSLPSLTKLAVREHRIVILMSMSSHLNWYERSIWYKR